MNFLTCFYVADCLQNLLKFYVSCRGLIQLVAEIFDCYWTPGKFLSLDKYHNICMREKTIFRDKSNPVWFFVILDSLNYIANESRVHSCKSNVINRQRNNDWRKLCTILLNEHCSTNNLFIEFNVYNKF